MEVLFGVSSQSDEDQHAKKQSAIHTIIEAVRSNFINLIFISNPFIQIWIFLITDVRVMVKNIPPNINVKDIKILFDKLEKCRNQDNNPESQA